MLLHNYNIVIYFRAFPVQLNKSHLGTTTPSVTG